MHRSKRLYPGMSEHLTEEQFDRFRRNQAGAAELFAWADHLGTCADCRRRSSDGSRIPELVRAIGESPSTDHLDFETMHALIEDRLDAIDWQIADFHLEDCARCRGELEDLKTFAKERRRPRRLNVQASRLRAAAAILALVIGGAWLVERQRTPAGGGGAPRAQPARTPALPEIPSLAIELHAYTRELRGRPRDANTLEPLSPIGRIVIEDRPRFEWTAVGRSRYVVEVFDQQYQPVARSPRLSTTSWIPPHALPADRVLTWQVTAIDSSGSITAPRPPSAEARFFILERNHARAIRSLEEQERPSLSLGMAYAENGALAEAQRELSALIAADRDTESARQLLLKVQRASP